MKKIAIMLYLLPLWVAGQTTSENHIKTYSYRQATETSNELKANVSVTYFDGLGRPTQQVAGKMTPDEKDIITHIEYDGFGRQAKNYLPYPAAETSNLEFDGSALTNTIQHYSDTYNDSYPFSEQVFEASPLNRVLKQGAPGYDWQPNSANSDHTVKLDYRTNISDEVKLLTVTAVWDPSQKIYDISLDNEGYYEQNQLYKTVTKDENWISGNNHTTEEFKNKEGQVILKIAYNDDTEHFTYYVYDQFGNLTYVIPPKAADELGEVNSILSQQIINNLCYTYKYDYRNRLVEKHVPGAGWVHMVYDKLDRLVLSQDENQRGNKWLFTKYDAFNRVVYTGEYSDTQNRAYLQDVLSTQTILSETKSSTPFTQDGTQVHYDNQAFPTSSFSLLTINYYDNYNFDLPQQITIPDHNIHGKVLSLQTQGLSTGSKVRVLGTDQWITTAIGYDSKGRVIWTKNRNPFLNNEYRVESNLNFVGQLAEQVKILNNYNINDLAIYNYYTYDSAGRLTQLRNRYRKNNVLSPLMLTSYNKYDDLGQLVEKKVGGLPGTGYNSTVGLQVVNYNYNIRGWLTDINDIDSTGETSIYGGDLFAFKIAYNNITDNTESNLDIKPLFNGNISETWWRTANDDILRKYSYNYDGLSRLTNAWYQKPDNEIPLAGNYNEATGYDKNGNITSMLRTGGLDEQPDIEIDDLKYTYFHDSNQLKKVTDGQTFNGSPQGFDNGQSQNNDDYTYDVNGNMISDLNKGIYLIEYNHLNLPKKIAFSLSRFIEYAYDATGRKLQKKVTDGPTITTTKYKEMFQYQNDTLQFFPTTEGYVKCSIEDYQYIYQYKDHLGNVRVSYSTKTKNNETRLFIVEEDNYYPFGLKHTGYNNDEDPLRSEVAQKYKYLGQERQDELGLDWDTFRHRNYDYAIGRFFGVDPVAEEYMSISPYQFAHNNPVWKIELEGLEGLETQGKDITNHEPVKVKSTPNQAFVGGGLVDVKVVQQSAQKVVEETTKRGSGTFFSGLVKTLGTAGALLSDYASPNMPRNEMSHTIRYKIQGEEVNSNYLVQTRANAEDDKGGEIIYRGGAFNDRNFTPRPGIDDGIGPSSGLSTFTDPLKATNGRGGRAQALSSNLLKAMGFKLTKKADGHVGVRPPSQTLLEKWAASRGLEPGSDPTQILTQMVKSARIEEVKIPKP